VQQEAVYPRGEGRGRARYETIVKQCDWKGTDREGEMFNTLEKRLRNRKQSPDSLGQLVGVGKERT